MGANISSQTMTSVSTIVNTGLNKVISDISTDIHNTTISTQRVDVELNDAVVNGTLSIHQSSYMSVRAMSQIKGKYATNMTNDIKAAIVKKLQSAAEQKNEGINVGQINTSIQDQKIKTHVHTELENIIETTVANVITNDVSADNTIFVRANRLRLDGNMVITQEHIVTNISNSIAKTLIDNTLSNKSKITELADMSQKASQVNMGISFSFIGLIILVLVVLFLFGFRVFMKYILLFGIAGCTAGIVLFHYKDEPEAMWGSVGGVVVFSALLVYTFIKNKRSIRASNATLYEPLLSDDDRYGSDDSRLTHTPVDTGSYEGRYALEETVEEQERLLSRRPRTQRMDPPYTGVETYMRRRRRDDGLV